MKEKIKNKKILLYLIIAVFFLVASILLCIYVTPALTALAHDDARDAFKERIEGLGIGGVFAMLFIQILQVFVAFIPGEPVEILMGVMYGTVGGLLLSLLGCAIGSALVFMAVRKFGQPLFEFFFEKKHLDRFAFLRNSKKLELFTFILFFIPGTPKDLLTYFAPLTPIDFWVFLFITIFARIPSIITSTYAGSTILEGNLLKTILIFAATAIIGISGIIVGNKISDKQNKENKS